MNIHWVYLHTVTERTFISWFDPFFLKNMEIKVNESLYFFLIVEYFTNILHRTTPDNKEKHELLQDSQKNMQKNKSSTQWSFKVYLKAIATSNTEKRLCLIVIATTAVNHVRYWNVVKIPG